MKLRNIVNLDELAERLAQQRGECRWCDIGHPAGQCKSPRNWSSDGPMRSAPAVADANETGEHGRYLRQLERQARRELAASIKL